jgi:ABC-type multidrug transport system fused ATPase/permease subunit
MRPSWAEASRLNHRIALLSVLVLAAYGTSTATLGWAAYHHTISLGALVVMLTTLPSSMQAGSVNATDFALEGMLSSVPDLDALTAELAAPEPAVAGAASVTGRPARDVTFEAVSFRYPETDQDVLSELDLVLEAGRSTAIVGVNGAGKTTLVTLLARLRDPTGGRILIDGRPLAELPAREWQRQVAVVYQDFTRFPLTARLWLERYVAGSRSATGGTVPSALRTGIRLESVTFTYPGRDEPVLRDVDLTLPAGSTVAIVGENGAGKTTLAKLLTRMYVPESGRILVDGEDLAAMPADGWRSRTTAVFQDFLRPSLTAREVVGVGDTRWRRRSCSPGSRRCHGPDARLAETRRGPGRRRPAGPRRSGHPCQGSAGDRLAYRRRLTLLLRRGRFPGRRGDRP